MDCIKCKNLEEAFESRLSKYIEACSAAYYRVSTELAAKKNVDMERARYDLEEHRFTCVYAAAVKRRTTGLAGELSANLNGVSPVHSLRPSRQGRPACAPLSTAWDLKLKGELSPKV